MEELLAKCKCGVYLEVNAHKDVYQSALDAIQEMYDYDGTLIDDDLAHRMITQDSIYKLQFYPSTPIGYHVVFGTSLKEVVEKALSCVGTGA